MSIFEKNIKLQFILETNQDYIPREVQYVDTCFMFYLPAIIISDTCDYYYSVLKT